MNGSVSPLFQVNDDYKSGLENGMQHALLNIINSPLPSNATDAYVAGYSHGVEAGRRVFAKTTGNSMVTEYGRLDNACLDNVCLGSVVIGNGEATATAIAEQQRVATYDSSGISCSGIACPGISCPDTMSDFCDPMECNSLENAILMEMPHGLTKLHYLRNGYAMYMMWLKNTMAEAGGLGADWSDYIHFAVARHINAHALANYGVVPMGCDIELIAFAHLHGNHNVTETDVTAKYNKNCNLQSVTIDSMKAAYSQSPVLTLYNFYQRLKNVHDKILDTHSRAVWRGTDGVLGCGAIHISVSNLQRGEPFAPPTGFHLGLYMLEKSGFLLPNTTPMYTQQSSSADLQQSDAHESNKNSAHQILNGLGKSSRVVLVTK